MEKGAVMENNGGSSWVGVVAMKYVWKYGSEGTNRSVAEEGWCFFAKNESCWEGEKIIFFNL